MNTIDLNGRCAVVTGGAQGSAARLPNASSHQARRSRSGITTSPFAEKTAKAIGPAVIARSRSTSPICRGREAPVTRR